MPTADGGSAGAGEDVRPGRPGVQDRFYFRRRDGYRFCLANLSKIFQLARGRRESD